MMPTRQTGLLLVFVPVVAVFAAEFHVAVNGDDRNDGSSSRPFKTITAAARAAQAGDTITVHAGTYRERVTPPRGGVWHARRGSVHPYPPAASRRDVTRSSRRLTMPTQPARNSRTGLV
ncbi:MAG: DUF1565 domain-containing protein [Acidobacteria bacterium]|nr:DUF1565 domain-containing protein [Acidobacteriota bacterium]MBI3280440.1 DUF1565 domain-containing protein [Acidobacteriota bacterium]